MRCAESKMATMQTQNLPSPDNAEFFRECHLARLGRAQPHDFAFEARAEELAPIARLMRIEAVGLLTIEGRLTPLAGADWKLTAELKAHLTQSCVVSLEPVTQKIRTNIIRYFKSEPDLEDEQQEMLSAKLDVGQLALEELALALPPFPRRKNARLPANAKQKQETGSSAPTRKPFAALAALKEQLGSSEKAAGSAPNTTPNETADIAQPPQSKKTHKSAGNTE